MTEETYPRQYSVLFWMVFAFAILILALLSPPYTEFDTIYTITFVSILCILVFANLLSEKARKTAHDIRKQIRKIPLKYRWLIVFSSLIILMIIFAPYWIYGTTLQVGLVYFVIGIFIFLGITIAIERDKNKTD